MKPQALSSAEAGGVSRPTHLGSVLMSPMRRRRRELLLPRLLLQGKVGLGLAAAGGQPRHRLVVVACVHDLGLGHGRQPFDVGRTNQ